MATANRNKASEALESQLSLAEQQSVIAAEARSMKFGNCSSQQGVTVSSTDRRDISEKQQSMRLLGPNVV